MYKLQKFYPKDFDPKKYWENRYSQEHVAGYSMDEFPKQKFWSLLKEQLKQGGKYLDAGCGIGGWILFLREQGYDVEGIDRASSAVRAISEYDRDAIVKIAGMAAMPYADKSLDGVLSIGALEYYENEVPKVLREVNRVLKSGGFFFLEVPNFNTLRRFLYAPLKAVEHFLKTAQGEEPTFANYLFDRGELKNMLEAAGFEVMNEAPHDLPDKGVHYGLYTDWKILRGEKPYELNGLGRLVEAVAESISPWIASTGMVVVAKKKS